MPKSHFPGGALVGCSAGFVNVARNNQGVHMAMKSGILAAEAAFAEMTRENARPDGPLHMEAYGRFLRDSWVMTELKQVCWSLRWICMHPI